MTQPDTPLTDVAQPSPETPAHMLARSAFGFALFALIPALITLLFFVLAPPSPFAIYRTVRWGIVAVFSVVVLGLLWATVYFYRTKPDAVLPMAERLAGFFGNPVVSVTFAILLIEVNIFLFLGLRGIAPSITNPARGLMIMWSFLLLGMVFVVQQRPITAWFSRTQNLWAAFGMTGVALAGVILLVSANSWFINLSGLNDLLRGGLDYRQLHFYDDGEAAPSPPDFWAEQAQISVRWSPYTYWVMSAFDGTYITVGSDGLRETPDYGRGTHDIYLFGGSTMWGEGARDAYTIPGHLARLLDENDTPQNVVNFGQSGYVSMQDVIWFQLQLQQGNVPDVAIFYQGFNDILSAWGAGQVGVTLQEDMRLNDAEAGRRLRAGQPVLRLPTLSLEDIDLSSAGVTPVSAEAIVDDWLANVALIEALASAYDVDVIFVWQPALIFKEPLTESEEAIIVRTNDERAGLFALYAEVDSLVRSRVTGNEDSLILLLSDLFAGSDEAIFHDLVHITEIGNAQVADALLPYVEDMIAD